MKRLLATIALLPRNACVVALRAYRAVISPLYGNVCRYHPSCSRYALEAIQQYGVVRGSAMGAWRIARCNPWAAGGIDDVPDRRRPYRVNRFGFVLAHQTTSSGAALSPDPVVPAPPVSVLASASSPRTPAFVPDAQLPRLINQPARKA